jgi:hypothetical protein
LAATTTSRTPTPSTAVARRTAVLDSPVRASSPDTTDAWLAELASGDVEVADPGDDVEVADVVDVVDSVGATGTGSTSHGKSTHGSGSGVAEIVVVVAVVVVGSDVVVDVVVVVVGWLPSTVNTLLSVNPEPSSTTSTFQLPAGALLTLIQAVPWLSTFGMMNGP